MKYLKLRTSYDFETSFKQKFIHFYIGKFNISGSNSSLPKYTFGGLVH